MSEDERRTRFEALAGEVVEPVRRYLARRTDPATADDALSDTLLVCWRRLDEVPERALPWVYVVARQSLANAERGRRRQERLADRLAAQPASPDTSGDPGAQGPADPELHEALARLRPEEAELVRLWAWEQLTPAEIAQVLGVSANAVSIRLHRARGRLREELGKTRAPAGQEQGERRQS